MAKRGGRQGRVAGGLCGLVLVGALLLGLPAAGVWLAGKPAAAYLQFPPLTLHIPHAPFSWPVFWWTALPVSAVGAAFLGKLMRHRGPGYRGKKRPLPWWAGLGAALVAVFWILAWQRFSWLAELQQYTFLP